MSAGRPSHIISPDEVDAWLADSAIRVVTYHRTTPWAAHSILEHGVDIRRSRIGAYGQGFYSATVALEGFGDTLLTVAVRLSRPLTGQAHDVERQIDDLIIEQYGTLRPITPDIAASIRRRFISLGYDGLVIHDVDDVGVDYVLAFFGASVKVVQS